MSRCARSVVVGVMSVMWAQPALADSINLAWDPNTESISGYAVYVGTQSGVYGQRFDVGPTNAFTYATATAGQRYCFAVAAYASSEGPKSAEVCGYSNRYPTLSNPGNQSSTSGQSVSLQLNGADPDGQPITYSATGLPAGLSLMASTGFISGAGTTTGTFSVTVRAFDGALTTSQAFTWTITAPAPAPDTTAPTVSIAAPTSAATFTSSAATIALSGSSGDNVGVTQVSWVNDRGGSGMAAGTTGWNVGTVTLQAGANVITVSARDAAGNAAADVLTVTYTAPVTDTTAPSVSINSPTTSSTFTASSSAFAIGGSAADNVGVTQVRWVNDRGGSGTASGTANWTASIALVSGTNNITVTALDGAGNVATDALSVAYNVTAPAPATVALSAELDRWSRYRKSARLSWTRANWSSVAVYRNNIRITSTSNDGTYSDQLRSPGTYNYKVCDSRGVACSNTVTVYY